MSFWTPGHSAGVWLHRLYKNWGARGGTLRTLKVARFGEILVRGRLGASANFMASKGIVGVRGQTPAECPGVQKLI